MVSDLWAVKEKGGCYFESLKPIFHWKLGSRWVPVANEIYTKNMKCTWPTPAFCVGTQRNLYSTDWRRGLASGVGIGDDTNFRFGMGGDANCSVR